MVSLARPDKKTSKGTGLIIHNMLSCQEVFTLPRNSVIKRLSISIIQKNTVDFLPQADRKAHTGWSLRPPPARKRLPDAPDRQ